MELRCTVFKELWPCFLLQAVWAYSEHAEGQQWLHWLCVQKWQDQVSGQRLVCSSQWSAVRAQPGGGQWTECRGSEGKITVLTSHDLRATVSDDHSSDVSVGVHESEGGMACWALELAALLMPQQSVSKQNLSNIFSIWALVVGCIFLKIHWLCLVSGAIKSWTK